MATKMVQAHGDNGPEWTAEDAVTVIPAAPLVDTFEGDYIATPASIRHFALAFGKPVRLTGIRRQAHGWIGVTWRDDRGERASCTVRNAREAGDPLFDGLPPRSRARILAAVAA